MNDLNDQDLNADLQNRKAQIRADIAARKTDPLDNEPLPYSPAIDDLSDDEA